MPDQKPTTLATIQHLIAEVTNNQPEDIVADTHLEDELGIEPGSPDHQALLRRIMREFHLDPETIDFEELIEAETVSELADLVDTELHLG